jgi:hypothetical protein
VPFALKLHRNKNVITALAVFFVFLLGVNGYASRAKTHPHIAYHSKLGHDLDGDHIPETATIRQSGYLYQVSIHFTTGRPKLRLTTYVTEGAAGLSLQTADVNDDRKRDLVVLSATSIRPVAVWLNQGRAKFLKVSAWQYGGAGRFTGRAYRSRTPSGPDESVSTDSVDPSPQANPVAHGFGIDVATAVCWEHQPELLPLDSLLSQVPSRGPPASARV